MDISVIVVTYNQEDTIARTLDSVLGQMFDGEFEVVVGDDCSSDGTQAVCEDYARRFPGRVRYLRRERNLGVVANYFGCIRQSRGRYLADCAGDDMWSDPHKLSRQFDYLEHHPDVTAVYTDWLCHNPDTADPRRHPLRPEVNGIETYSRGELVLPVLTNTILPHLCTALYRRDVILKYMEHEPERFMSASYVAEDPQIMMALSAEGKTAVMSGVTMLYTVGGDSVSHRAEAGRRLRHFVGETAQQIALAGLFGGDGPVFRRYLKKKMDYMWSLAWRSGDREATASLRRLASAHNLHGGWKSLAYGLAVRLK